MTMTEGQDQPDQSRKIPPLMVATWEAATTDSDPLAALGATRALVSLLCAWETQLVGEAVADGATWEVIGGTVGVSRQAAWERFHSDVNEFRRRMKNDLHELRSRHRQEMLEFKESLKSQARANRRHSH
jgi:hypothetical protein